MDGGSIPALPPVIHGASFDGPLDLLLDLARAQKVDLGGIAIAELVDPFVAAIAAAAKTVPLAQLGAWLVTASWLTLLKSRLRERITEAAHARALAFWLEARAQLGQDVFARGVPEAPIPELPAAGDRLDLLLACFAVYELPLPPVTTPPDRPSRRLDLCTLQDALARIRRWLAEHPEGGELARLLPPPAPAAAASPLRARSALASTFVAGLELTKQHAIRMTQDQAFGPIHLQAMQPAEHY